MPNKNSTSVHCNFCNAPINIPDDKKMVPCEYCGTMFIVPREIKDSSEIEKASAELTISRLKKEYEKLELKKNQELFQIRDNIDSKQGSQDRLKQEMKRLRSKKGLQIRRMLLPGIFLAAFSFYTLWVFGRTFSTFDYIVVGGIELFLIIRFLGRIKNLQRTNSQIYTASSDLESTYSASAISQLRSDLRLKENSYNKDLSAIKEKLDEKYRIVD